VFSVSSCAFQSSLPPAEREAAARRRWAACPTICRETWAHLELPLLLTNEQRSSADHGCAQASAEACLKAACAVDSRCLESDERDRARGLYQQACTRENIDGCLNASALEAAPGRADSWSARVGDLGVVQCRSGRYHACLDLARALDEGLNGLARRPDLAYAVIDAACASGAKAACQDNRLRRVTDPSHGPSLP
jgi:hypothetical protein